jgi:2-dehydropantoate 2-reductase
MTTQTIGILGLGAIGTLMAAHWQGQPLYALTRDRQKRCCQIEDNGQISRFTLPPWQGQKLHWLVITTKAAATITALQHWQSWLDRVDNLLLLQNGMGQHEQLAAWLDQQALPASPHIWAGISTEGAWRRDNGSVVRAGRGEVLIGPMPHHHHTADPANGDTNAALTATAPPQTRIVDDIRLRQRQKLAINAVINPLTAKLRCCNGELIHNPDYQPLFLQLCQEISHLYQQLNWPLGFDLTERATAVAIATAANRSSTLQDHLAGRPDELDWISGYLLRAAHSAGLALPLSQQLLDNARSASSNIRQGNSG